MDSGPTTETIPWLKRVAFAVMGVLAKMVVNTGKAVVTDGVTETGVDRRSSTNLRPEVLPVARPPQRSFSCCVEAYTVLAQSWALRGRLSVLASCEEEGRM